jgi:hypothetical protein
MAGVESRRSDRWTRRVKSETLDQGPTWVATVEW